MTKKIKEYYSGKSILVTGGLGFIGKILIEKLLFSCSDLKQIFVLIRKKNNQNVDERLRELLKSKAFDRIRSEKPQVLKKIKPISGDIVKKNYELSNDDFDQLIRETNIIFNIAAAVDFTAPIQAAFTNNVMSLKYLIAIAREMKKLESLMHISTGFCIPGHNDIYEKIYETEIDSHWILSDDPKVHYENLSIALKNGLYGHPSTYSYTKRLSEILADVESKNLPICVARPSIVFPSHAEPTSQPGWVDTLMSPAGEMVAIGKGVKRSTFCDKKLILNMMSVDSTARGMIAIAWDLGQKREKPLQTPVYNLNWPHSIIGSYTIEICMSKLLEKIRIRPFAGAVWYPNVRLTSWKFLHIYRVILYQLIPSLFIDLFLMLTGNKPFLFAKQYEMMQIQNNMSWYCVNASNFKVDNLQSIQDKMSKDEVEEFEIFPSNFDMEKYYDSYIEGVRTFLLNQTNDDITKARFQLKFLKFLNAFTKLSTIIFFIYLFVQFLDYCFVIQFNVPFA